MLIIIRQDWRWRQSDCLETFRSYLCLFIYFCTLLFVIFLRCIKVLYITCIIAKWDPLFNILEKQGKMFWIKYYVYIYRQTNMYWVIITINYYRIVCQSIVCVKWWLLLGVKLLPLQSPEAHWKSHTAHYQTCGKKIPHNWMLFTAFL